jgi:glutamate-1-semialdehyde 2,1-aminomutase
VNSPVRAFGAVGGSPPFIARGRGARLFDADGREYVDFVGSWGPLILGHAHPDVVRAVRETVARGATFGAPTAGEVELAREIAAAFSSIERVRLVNSGTEAVMSAIRVARAATGRARIVKFEGCYHGHADGLLVRAGSGAATFGVPSSAGVPAQIARLTDVLPYNDADAARRHLRRHARKIAAVVVEPVAANMGVVPPAPGFLETLREETSRHDIALIFDEVVTGFRVCYGGWQTVCKIRPDLTVLGKIIGGGFPIGAYGGRADWMRLVAPEGPVYQAGTLSGNPVAVAAGLATLRVLRRPGVYDRLERLGAALEARVAGPGRVVQRVGSMLTVFFRRRPVRNWSDAASCDTAAYARYFHRLLRGGVYAPPSQFEAWFVSLAHTARDLQGVRA